mgnify:CR=1 FL=1
MTHMIRRAALLLWTATFAAGCAGPAAEQRGTRSLTVDGPEGSVIAPLGFPQLREPLWAPGDVAYDCVDGSPSRDMDPVHAIELRLVLFGPRPRVELVSSTSSRSEAVRRCIEEVFGSFEWEVEAMEPDGVPFRVEFR